MSQRYLNCNVIKQFNGALSAVFVPFQCRVPRFVFVVLLYQGTQAKNT